MIAGTCDMIIAGSYDKHCSSYVRYEVSYSEHSSFPELKEFVKHISPINIIPGVNNNGPEPSAQMISLLSS